MYITEIELYPQENGEYETSPHTKTIRGINPPSPAEIRESIMDLIELNNLDNTSLLCEQLIEKDGKYHSSDECVINPHIIRSTKASLLIKQKPGAQPTIYMIDRIQSKLDILPA